jgi:hypothetical protein
VRVAHQRPRWHRSRFARSFRSGKPAVDAESFVLDVIADDDGGLRIVLTAGYTLEVIADHTRDAELWRFFRVIDESPHFVMTGQGIEA